MFQDTVMISTTIFRISQGAFDRIHPTKEPYLPRNDVKSSTCSWFENPKKEVRSLPMNRNQLRIPILFSAQIESLIATKNIYIKHPSYNIVLLILHTYIYSTFICIYLLLRLRELH